MRCYPQGILASFPIWKSGLHTRARTHTHKQTHTYAGIHAAHMYTHTLFRQKNLRMTNRNRLLKLQGNNYGLPRGCLFAESAQVVLLGAMATLHACKQFHVARVVLAVSVTRCRSRDNLLANHCGILLIHQLIPSLVEHIDTALCGSRIINTTDETLFFTLCRRALPHDTVARINSAFQGMVGFECCHNDIRCKFQMVLTCPKCA